jgi:predicted ribosome quality control (RQC) complex YloA/Tae2 family protein
MGEAEMGIKKLSEKVEDYQARLESGKASKIKPGHVEKVLQKLRVKTAELESEIAAAPSADKKARLGGKLAIARTHIARAEWLLEELGRAP